MEHQKREGFNLSIITTSLVSGLCLGVIIFLLARTLINSENVSLYLILACIAATTSISAGLAITFYLKLRISRMDLVNFKEQALHDKLTALYNRTNLDPFLESEIDAASKANQQVSMIMVDMDHFREINKNYGRVVGDHVLSIFAQVVLKCIRKTDIIARYGGDEFIVVLPSTDTDTARAVAERIRQDVSEAHIPPIDNVVISSISCSVGVSTYPVLCDSKNSLLKTSDLALYKAKQSGRNCTMVYQNELAVN